MSLSRRKFTKEFKEAAVRRLELRASIPTKYDRVWFMG
jgi:transposase-like protein